MGGDTSVGVRVGGTGVGGAGIGMDIPAGAHTNVLGSSTPSLHSDARAGDTRGGNKRRRDSYKGEDKDKHTDAGIGEDTDRDRERYQIAQSQSLHMSHMSDMAHTSAKSSLRRTIQIEKGRLRCLIELGQLDR